MYKILNLFFAIIIVLFFFNVFRYYSSNLNIKLINTNRVNSESLVKTKSSNIPVLESNTINIIEFNSGFSDEIKNDKPRSFWNLFKIK
tara:strand:- start:737 stop:1000 length:264 start_codon:yes stop_codon:yes gene_type:complete